MNTRPSVMDILSRLLDLLLLNILFVFTSVPIVTLGPSLYALYGVTGTLVETDSAHIVKDYFRFFRQGFPRAVAPALLFLLVFFCLYLNILLSYAGGLFLIVGMVSTVFAVGLYVFFLFYFPVLVHVRCKVWEVFRYTAQLFGQRPGTCIGIVVMTLPFAFFALYSVYTAAAIGVFGLVIGFALVVYVKSHLFARLFHQSSC